MSLVGCAAEDPAGTIEQSMESQNALSLNALSLNALSLNALSLNALSLNALSLNSFELDTVATEGLETTVAGRALLRYIARCALVEGDELVVNDGTAQHAFSGLLGLAPEWLAQGLDEIGERKISACLLAHANLFGVQVPISLRSVELDSRFGEMLGYSVHEATFFGSLFGPGSAMFACHGVDEDTAIAQATARELRVCSDRDEVDERESEGPMQTRCSTDDAPVFDLGACDAVCVGSWWTTSYESCKGPDGAVYEQPISVYLYRDIHSWSFDSSDQWTWSSDGDRNTPSVGDYDNDNDSDSDSDD